MEKMEKALQHVDLEMDINSLPDDSEVYSCVLCRDTGWVNDGERAWPCKCGEESRLAGMRRLAGLGTRLAKCRFDNFQFSFYPDKPLSEKQITYLALAKKAFNACCSFVNEYASNGNPKGIMLLGNSASGKTHLASAVANELLKYDEHVLFLVVPELLDQLRASYRLENEGLDETEIVRRAYAAGVLILDDLGAHNFSEWVQNKLFTIINYRLNNELPIVVTTNLTIRDMQEAIGRRAASRLLESCDIYRLMVERDIRQVIYQGV